MKNKEQHSLDLICPLSFCVFDLETTGGNHSFDKIIEIGLVKIKNLKIVDEMSFLIDPEIEIPEFIQKLTSIKPDDLKKAPKIFEIIDQILNFMGDSILVAHNSGFDVPFFNSVLERLGRKRLENKVICTNLMTKYLIPDIMNSNLAYMSNIFDISHNKAHRALEDAKAASELLLKYLHFFIDKNIKKINQLYYPRNKFELDRCHFKQGTPFDQIFAIVKNCKSPLWVLFKGDKGIHQACLPLIGDEKEYQLFEHFYKTLKWETVTLKMAGTFIEEFLNFNMHFNKMDESISEMALEHLVQQHLGGKIASLAQRQEVKNFDFLIVNHLIPQQLIIYPLMNLFPKSELVFRFPGHRKN